MPSENTVHVIGLLFLHAFIAAFLARILASRSASRLAFSFEYASLSFACLGVGIAMVVEVVRTTRGGSPAGATVVS